MQGFAGELKMKKLACIALLTVIANSGLAQTNRIDTVRPDAPELAQFGGYTIGVRTVDIIDPNRIDILNTPRDGDSVRYDRPLTLEIWYPAELADGQSPGGEYKAITRNPAIIATLGGKAVRDAKPLTADGEFPLVIISHGYPGNRYLLSHLGENLASKGYVVASVDHTDSTYDDQKAFSSTLYNRPLDQRFVLDTMAGFGEDSGHFLSGMLDADTTAVVGYSMGGYGLVNNLGGGYTDEIIGSLIAPPNKLLNAHATRNPEYRGSLDSRIKAGVAVAPWGMNANFWTAEDLASISVPALYIAGDADTVAGYENGPRAIYEYATGSDRYLLTFKNAGHNAAAPYPLPLEILNSDDKMGASHYTDPVWDTVRMNNIMDHFVTAYLDLYLKGDESKLEYLDVVPDGANGKYSVSSGKENADHSYWKGFESGSAVGLKLEHLGKGQ
ncbi:MAG: putative dienelactone hydrolase [Pseudohongiellaceae bacterium]|jgi:predicted dienelactone hydrolase